MQIQAAILDVDGTLVDSDLHAHAWQRVLAKYGNAIPYGKVCSQIFQAALGKLGQSIVPANSFVLGDTPYDADAAGKLGLRTIGMLYGGFLEESLRESGASVIFRDPADLLARYEQTPFANA